MVCSLWWFCEFSSVAGYKPLFQGFLEMASEEAAVTMINYYTSAPPTIRNQPVFIQYSTHRELKTDNLPNQVRICSFKYFKIIHRNKLTFNVKKKLFSHREWRCRPSAQQQCILGTLRLVEKDGALVRVRAPSWESLWRIYSTRWPWRSCSRCCHTLSTYLSVCSTGSRALDKVQLY